LYDHVNYSDIERIHVSIPVAATTKKMEIRTFVLISVGPSKILLFNQGIFRVQR